MKYNIPIVTFDFIYTSLMKNKKLEDLEIKSYYLFEPVKMREDNTNFEPILGEESESPKLEIKLENRSDLPSKISEMSMDQLKKKALEEYEKSRSQKPALKFELTREDVASVLSSKQMEGYDYYQTHQKDIDSNYYGKWIGIKDGEVLFPSIDDIELLIKLERGEYNDVYIIHVGGKPKIHEIYALTVENIQNSIQLNGHVFFYNLNQNKAATEDSKFDTGADGTTITENIVTRLELKNPKPFLGGGVGGRFVSREYSCIVDFCGVKKRIWAPVTPRSLIGMDFILQFLSVLDGPSKTLQIK